MNHPLSKRVALAGLILWISLPPTVASHDSPEKQIQTLSEDLEHSPDAVLYLLRGDRHRMAGRWDAALSDYSCAERLAPHLPALPLARATLWLDREDVSAASRELRQAAAATRRLAEYNRLVSLVAEREGDFGASWLAYRDYRDRVARARPAHALREAELALAKSPPDTLSATKTLALALRRWGSPPAVALRLADLSFAQGDSDAGLAALNSLSPTPGMLLRQGDGLRAGGNHLAALERYTAARQALLELPEARRHTLAAQALLHQLDRHLAQTSPPSATGARP